MSGTEESSNDTYCPSFLQMI